MSDISLIPVNIETEDYAPGMRLIIRDEEWMVKKVESNSLGNKTLHCVGISSLVKDHEAMFLADLEGIEKVDPAKVKLVSDDSPFFRRSRLYIESQWRQKIPTDTALHIGSNAAMDLMGYQLEPAQIALKKPRQRILIADTVGLGKTLEAGILMSELIIRGKGKRILVVTVKSMMAQFQKEMWNRFTIPLVRLDSSKISRIRASLPTNHNPFFYYDKTIVSIDTIKRDVEYRTHLEEARWDIIVIDEAQNVAERGNQAQRARLAKLLAGRSDTLILLSATPHDGRSESFASLMNMLDPTAIADPHNYSKNDINGLCVRRFKKDIKDQVHGSFKERVVTSDECDASPEEESVFRYFTDMKLDMDIGREKNNSHLFKTGLEKAMFSSPAACIKSIEERLKKLAKKYQSEIVKDAIALNGLKELLEKVQPSSFSRYQQLLALLKNKDYAWSMDKNDRIVIFTERIETMRFLADQLKKDLRIKKEAIQELYGGMTDTEQQAIVENFGRDESPIRLLVASDVASEGINLHYLSHRLIHFDIPWSLMVFQQRNGRIDRYGQTEQPDIRYFKIKSANQIINGDMQIIATLIKKEDQAYKNIGDPTLLMGKPNIEEEESITAYAIESGISPDRFGSQLDEAESEFDLFEALMAGAMETDEFQQASDDGTLFSDLDYIKAAVPYLSQNSRNAIQNLSAVEGVEIKISTDLRKRLKSLLPEEAIPVGDYLRLSPDKAFVMSEMARSMQNILSETIWPKTQYLWRLHPLFIWVNDKSSLLYGRGEAPIIGLNGRIEEGSALFIVAGTIPNRRSAPVVDEWFGLYYQNGELSRELAMDEVLEITKISQSDLPNPNLVTEEQAFETEKLLQKVVSDAQIILEQHFIKYNDEINPKIDEEKSKLAMLKDQHRNYQLSFIMDYREKYEKERLIEETFKEFENWVTDALQIENNPYIRIIAAFVGVH